MMYKLVLIILLIVIYLTYFNKSYENMGNLSEYIDKSVLCSTNKMQHHDVCQIQQPQLGKNRPYVNWQKIHEYGSNPY